MLVFDSRSWPQHRPWMISTLLIAVLAIVWYLAWSIGKSEWPGGSSLPGFTFGVVGGLICLFELLLWFRKKVRTWRIGRAQVWMRAHIWLGLLSVPLLVLHSGFRSGGDLSTILMILFLVVIASGVWGLAFQQLIPRTMLAEVPAETIYSQIPRIVEHMSEEAERLVLATCGPNPSGDTERAESIEPKPFLTLGAMRSAGKTTGKVLQTIVPNAPVAGTEILRNFYDTTIEPYLRAGPRVRSPLHSARQTAVLFSNLRTNLDPEAHHCVDALEGMCEQRRQFAHQARLFFWLHCWLSVHLPLSFALIVLMIAHIVKACMYW